MHRSKEIRNEFIDFFRSKGHTFVPSAPVIPAGDPTLLFNNAGMNQFKDVFLGTGTRDYKRAVNSQKCIRVSGKHNDLEEVGRDTYHHTFFEMLGNWSFGDYGKKEAIAWAWELLTGVWKLPPERLYATVYRDDDEAERIWLKSIGIPLERLERFGSENFWEMGEVGPCGPCSEIHIDQGPDSCDLAHVPGHRCGINRGCRRYIELWNLVFISLERHEDGSLAPLPQAHVDTGMGFERISAVLQGKLSNYETDLFMPLIGRVSELSGIDYSPGNQGMAHRVVADHVRMLAFALADGAVPSNEGRGYVVRRILRRAARFGRELGMHEPFIYRLVSTVVDLMGQAYPEIVSRSQHVSQVVKAEEESFGVTLDRGLELFESLAEKVKKEGGAGIGGRDAFKLYDTYGFPLDLTVLMAREKSLEVDEQGFQECMEERRRMSRSDRKFAADSLGARWAERLGQVAASEFDGYGSLSLDALLLGADPDCIILDRTPFYPEGGGQVADRGTITGSGFVFEIEDVRRHGSLILHEGSFAKGDVSRAEPGAKVRAEVDPARRLATARNHTATHLLHRVLREQLGQSARQAGSVVDPDRLRFDFNHYEKIPEETLLAIEKKVNRQIRDDLPVLKKETDYEAAIEEGAVALFGEKYDRRVRVVEVENFTKELCGGTHVERTGQLGSFVIVAESGVAAGIRRIEALTGQAAADYLLERSRILGEIERTLSAKNGEVARRVDQLIQERKSMEKELAASRGQARSSEMDHLLQGAEKLPGGTTLLVHVDQSADTEQLKALGDSFREKCSSGVALFGSRKGGKALFVCAVTDDLVAGGRLKAGELVGQVARIAGGSGGGKPHLATAGGKDLEKFSQAMDALGRLVKEKLSQ